MRTGPASPPVKVLLVEDNPADARLVEETLREEKDKNFNLEWVTDIPPALARLEKRDIDVVITDLNLPSSTGLGTIRSLREHAGSAPILVLTGTYHNHPMGVLSVREGAQDYLNKEEITTRWLSRLISFAIERKQLERLKEEFIQNANHELRTPVAAAYGFLCAVLDGRIGQTPEGRLRNYLEIALRNLRRAKRIVDDLMEAVRGQTGKLAIDPQRTDAAGLARQSVMDAQMAARKKNILLAAETDEGLPMILADPIRCRQILDNLIGNALKFTLPGGRVTVRASMAPRNKAAVQFSVSDTGCGMTPEVSSRIFERLYQAETPGKKSRGLGIGLYICAQLVSVQGGTIRVKSKPGRGSAFFFTLPVFRPVGNLISARCAAPSSGGRSRSSPRFTAKRACAPGASR